MADDEPIVALDVATLAELMAAPDDDAALFAFRRERLGDDSDIGIEQLRTARVVMAALSAEHSPGSITNPLHQRDVPSAQISQHELMATADRLASREVAVGSRSMTPAIYAALCAACGAFPSRVGETHAKFGIPDDEARQALDDAWQRCFDEEPRLKELWEMLFKQFRAWLIQYGDV